MQIIIWSSAENKKLYFSLNFEKLKYLPGPKSNNFPFFRFCWLLGCWNGIDIRAKNV